MGITADAARFLVHARQRGVRFDSVLTLGRQQVSVSPGRLVRLLRDGGCWPPPEGEAAFVSALARTSWRFEPFARALGAKRVDACDASAYEGAAVVHDLNSPIPEAWAERYDVVLDGGTLEHVFNFPVAIANCMRWVKPGGHLILITPANNQCGHGFYQFSPELFYRVLGAENGFEILRMVALCDAGGVSRWLGVTYVFPITSPWYEVSDPARIHSRVTMLNSKPVMLFVLARKNNTTVLFQRSPQQSDYLELWASDSPANPLGQSNAGERLVKWLTARLPEGLWRDVLPRLLALADPCRLRRFRRRHSFANRTCYRRVRE